MSARTPARSGPEQARGIAGGAASTAVRVVIDAADDPAWTRAALDAHHPDSGRITLHPTCGASSPPALAQDLLRTLGHQLPPRNPNTPRHRATWADQATPAWTAAACWTGAHRIGHLIVLRAHTLTPTRWEQLAALRRQTGIHLTLVWHRPMDTALRERAARLGTGCQMINSLDTARARWKEKGPKRPRPARHPDAGPRPHGSGQHLIDHVPRIGHPLHAGLLAAHLISHSNQPEQLAAVRLKDLAPDATALALPHPPYRPTSKLTWHPVPTWAGPLLTAARAWHYLTGHPHPSHKLFQHLNFHHHNQLTDIAAALGITAAITTLTGDPAWPTPTDTR